MLDPNDPHVHANKDELVEEDAPDRTKWIWLGVIGLFVLMLVALWLRGPTPPTESVVRARHIFIRCDVNDPVDRARALEEITELRERIVAGESFERIAREYSDDQHNARRGGDLGYMPRGSFDGDFETYVWMAPIGELSPIIQTSYGLHLVVVEERILTEIEEYRLRRQQEQRQSQ